MLLRAGVDASEVERALYVALERRKTLSRFIVDERSELGVFLERELARGDFPSIEMIRPEKSLIGALPPGLCVRLGAVPVHRDARSGRVDVAVLDPFDPHLRSELEFHLEAPVRLLRASDATLLAALRELGEPTSPSGPPLPLVRKAPDDRDDGAEPVLSLSRPKSDRKSEIVPSAQRTPEMPPTTERTSSIEPTQRASPAPPAPSAPPAPEPLADIIDAISRAERAEELAALIVRGMAPAPTIVLSVRSGVYSGRAASPWLRAEGVKKLKLDAGIPSVVETAARTGFYLGVLPLTPAHAPFRELFAGGDEREVYVVPVLMSGHPSLMIVSEVAPLGSSVDASRRADELSRAVGRALERIVLSKKRGG